MAHDSNLAPPTIRRRFVFVKRLAIAALLVASAVNALGDQTEVAQGRIVPWTRWTFHAFPSKVDFTGKPHAPDLVKPKEFAYRSRIRDAVKKGPNFAGHYTIAKWGCGSPCVAFVIVDARFGTTFDPGVTVGCADKTGMEAKIDFRLTSRLVIVTDFEEGLGCGTGYYEWFDRHLNPVYFAPWRYGHRMHRTVTGLPRYMTDMFQPVPTFPGAPQTVRTVDCFRSFTTDNSMFDLARKCGNPDERQGSGISIFIYDMDDGSIVAAGTQDLSRGHLLYVQHLVAKGRKDESLLKESANLGKAQ